MRADNARKVRLVAECQKNTSEREAGLEDDLARELEEERPRDPLRAPRRAELVRSVLRSRHQQPQRHAERNVPYETFELSTMPSKVCNHYYWQDIERPIYAMAQRKMLRE